MTFYFMLPRIVSGIGVIYDTSLCCDKFSIELFLVEVASSVEVFKGAVTFVKCLVGVTSIIKNIYKLYYY